MSEHPDKLNTLNNSDQQITDHCDDSVDMATESPSISRRKFTRNALLGGAVLLTLSNRSAWGVPKDVMCISTNVLMSFENGASALTDDQINEINNFYTVRDNYVGNDSVNRQSSYRTGDVTEVGTDTCFEYKPNNSQK